MGFTKKDASAGLEISRDCINIVEIEPRGNEIILKKRGKIDNLSSLINPSLSALNISDEGKFKEAVNNLFESLSLRKRRISVAIPDESVKASFLEFEDIPAERDKVIELIKWNLKKSLPFPPDEAAVDFQITDTPSGENRFYRLFAAAMKKGVLDQYERLLKACNLRPEIIIPSSFAVYNLYHDGLSGEENYVLLTASQKRIFVMLVKKGMPSFHRSRAVDNERDGLREIAASFNYYQDTCGDIPARVYVLDCGYGFLNLKGEIEKYQGVKDVKPLHIADMIKGADSAMNDFSGAAGAALRYED